MGVAKIGQLNPNGWSGAKNNYRNQFLVSINPYVHTHHAYIYMKTKINIFGHNWPKLAN